MQSARVDLQAVGALEFFGELYSLAKGFGPFLRVIFRRIDSIPVDILIPVGTAMPDTEYIGNACLARLNVSFEVRCDEDFYGENCLTFCSNFDSCDGCGLTGFTGEFCHRLYTLRNRDWKRPFNLLAVSVSPAHAHLQSFLAQPPPALTLMPLSSCLELLLSCVMF